jgi:hypothetical protein
MLVRTSRSSRPPRRARRFIAGAAVLTVALVIPQVADAAVTVQPSIVWTDPLPDVTPNAAGAISDDTIHMFLEKDNQTLALPLVVDGAVPRLYDDPTDLLAPKAVIPAGAVIDSYLLHADVTGEPAVGPKLTGTVSFDQEILGVIFTSGTLVGSDVAAGLATTQYLQGPLGRRGLEGFLPDEILAKDSVDWVDAHTVRVSFNINTEVDEVRIITRAAASPLPTPDPTPGDPNPAPIPTTPGISVGYRFVASDGGVFSFNRAFYGSTGAMTLNQPIVVGTETSTGRGYWLIARDGGVFSFGDAKFHGSTGAITLNQPIVAMAATPDDRGYWLFASDGGVFTFGSAEFKGSAPANKTKLNAPVVAAGATPDGGGYWVATADGQVLNYGTAGSYGSAANVKLSQPIVAFAPTASGKGYWLLGRDGGIFTYGDAAFFGSTGAMKLNQPVVAMQPTPTGKGYWLVATDGGVFSFGDAKFMGSTGGMKLARPIVGVL